MTNTAELIDIDSLVDMNIAPQCEVSVHNISERHSGDAKYLVRMHPHCSAPYIKMLCKPAWDYAGMWGLVCNVCGSRAEREERWTIVEVL